MTESQFLMLQFLTSASLVIIVVAITVSDVRERRIPNRFVLAGLFIAMIWHVSAPQGLGLFDAYTAGGLGLTSSLMGAGMCFGVFLVLHVLGVMGAGDVKLMAFMGALFGANHSVDLIVTVLLCGGVLAATRMIGGGRFVRVISNLKLIVLDRMLAPTGGAIFDPEKDTVERLPFALAICSAAVLLAFAQQKGMSLPWAFYG